MYPKSEYCQFTINKRQKNECFLTFLPFGNGRKAKTAVRSTPRTAFREGALKGSQSANYAVSIFIPYNKEEKP